MIRKFFLSLMIILLPLVPTIAQADHLRPWRSPDSVLIPPKQYDPRLVGLPRGTRIVFVLHKDMQKACNNLAGYAKFGPYVDECASRRKLTIILPSDAPPALRVALRRHGGGHVNSGSAGHTNWYRAVIAAMGLTDGDPDTEGGEE